MLVNVHELEQFWIVFVVVWVVADHGKIDHELGVVLEGLRQVFVVDVADFTHSLGKCRDELAIELVIEHLFEVVIFLILLFVIVWYHERQRCFRLVLRVRCVQVLGTTWRRLLAPIGLIDADKYIVLLLKFLAAFEERIDDTANVNVIIELVLRFQLHVWVDDVGDPVHQRSHHRLAGKYIVLHFFDGVRARITAEQYSLPSQQGIIDQHRYFWTKLLYEFVKTRGCNVV